MCHSIRYYMYLITCLSLSRLSFSMSTADTHSVAVIDCVCILYVHIPGAHSYINVQVLQCAFILIIGRM